MISTPNYTFSDTALDDIFPTTTFAGLKLLFAVVEFRKMVRGGCYLMPFTVDYTSRAKDISSRSISITIFWRSEWDGTMYGGRRQVYGSILTLLISSLPSSVVVYLVGRV